MTAVTILAFVYIPLNLATSIFGMNLVELNNSGKKLGFFLTTAVVILVITGDSWFLIEEINNYSRWKRSHDARIPQGYCEPVAKMQLAVGARIGMLALLWKDGHKSWM